MLRVPVFPSQSSLINSLSSYSTSGTVTSPDFNINGCEWWIIACKQQQEEEDNNHHLYQVNRNEKNTQLSLNKKQSWHLQDDGTLIHVPPVSSSSSLSLSSSSSHTPHHSFRRTQYFPYILSSLNNSYDTTSSSLNKSKSSTASIPPSAFPILSSLLPTLLTPFTQGFNVSLTLWGYMNIDRNILFNITIDKCVEEVLRMIEVSHTSQDSTAGNYILSLSSCALFENTIVDLYESSLSPHHIQHDSFEQLLTYRFDNINEYQRLRTLQNNNFSIVKQKYHHVVCLQLYQERKGRLSKLYVSNKHNAYIHIFNIYHHDEHLC